MLCNLVFCLLYYDSIQCVDTLVDDILCELVAITLWMGMWDGQDNTLSTLDSVLVDRLANSHCVHQRSL